MITASVYRRRCANSGSAGVMLLETPLIDHSDWKTYEIRFTPEKAVRFLIFEAFFSEKRFSRRGNVLIDNMSPIKQCPRV